MVCPLTSSIRRDRVAEDSRGRSEYANFPPGSSSEGRTSPLSGAHDDPASPLLEHAAYTALVPPMTRFRNGELEGNTDGEDDMLIREDNSLVSDTEEEEERGGADDPEPSQQGGNDDVATTTTSDNPERSSFIGDTTHASITDAMAPRRHLKTFS